MDRLCDEVIQLIFYELDDPSALTQVSRRLLLCSRDPYVRAHYFLYRYGRIQAMFWALSRGRLMSERVVDILINSGAHLSRYLVQIAIHHYFRTTSHFVKTLWVRSIPLTVFTHFLKVASDMYGDIPHAKGEDDGSIFQTFLKESRYPTDMKSIKWEDVRRILEKYKFIPFSVKDPIMAQFPLVLAIEPRLLPFAVANGFHMDPKYRDFVFRKMFEKLAMASEARTDEIMRNVRELQRLDSRMFLSRTVAAEICMEAKANESAYNALKKLDRSGELLFDLSTLVEDLIKLFARTRSVTTNYTILVLRQLFADFPSTDQTVRLVLLLTVFIPDNCLIHTPPSTMRTRLESLGLSPLTKSDLVSLLTNPFIERHGPVLEYARLELDFTATDIKELILEIAVKSLEIGCKGRMLKRLFDSYPNLQDQVSEIVVEKYQLDVDDLPPHEHEEACAAYEAKLCRDFLAQKGGNTSRAGAAPPMMGEAHHGEVNVHGQEVVHTDEEGHSEGHADEQEVDEGLDEDPEEDDPSTDDPSDLGPIGQDTLTTMIRQDELAPTRSRRRSFFSFAYHGGDVSGKLQYPADPMPVGRWIRDRYGVRSHVMAIFMIHAVINDNTTILHSYLSFTTSNSLMASHVPVTLKHFKLLARLGRAPSWCLFHEIELGAEFYFNEDDYLDKQPGSDVNRPFPQKVRTKVEIKTESTPPSIPPEAFGSSGLSRSPKKRPRRSAAITVRSYAVPDSDDEAIAENDGDAVVTTLMSIEARKRRIESNLQRWIKHLSLLLKDEQRKYKEKKKRWEQNAGSDVKVRVPKSDFFKSLTTNLRILRRLDQEKRKQLYGPDVADEDYSEDEDDEYQYRTNRAAKRRRIAN